MTMNDPKDPEAAIYAKVPAKDASGSGDESSTTPPYLQILQHLQSTAIRAQSSQDPAAAAAADAEEKTESSSPYDNIRRQSESTWDLSSDALLATLLHEFSSHVVSRTHRTAAEIRNLQDSVNDAGIDVALVQTEFMKRSADIFMEQVVGEEDDDDETDSEEDGGDDEGDAAEDGDEQERSGRSEELGDEKDDDDSSADIARLEAEERSAIADGMKALGLFFDPKRNGGGDGGSCGDVETMMDSEEDIIGENCYYYPSAEEDGFNQRPLPFIVGSREFMESSSAGLGGENRGGDE